MEFRCDIRGGLLARDVSGEFAACGMRYPKERLRVKVQEIKGTVKVSGIKEGDDYIKEAKKLLSKSLFDDADITLRKALENDRTNAEIPFSK